MNDLIIGKRITIGAAITSLATAIGNMFPEHATIIVGFSVPITFAVQVWIANKFGVTTK